MALFDSRTRIAIIGVIALAVAACSPFGGSVESNIAVRCPERLVTVDKGERPVKPRPVEDNFADLYAFAEALDAYTSRIEVQEAARDAQIDDCEEIAAN